MNCNRSISAILSIGISAIAPLCPVVTPPVAAALASAEVNAIAKEITVRVDGPTGHGSGVIFEKKGSTYYIVTNWHVVSKTGDYQVLTADGKRHPVYYSLIKRVPGADLAVVPFSSAESYRLAVLANFDQASEGKKLYVAGWPRSGGTLQQPILIVTEGLFTRRQAPWNGYTLVYSNLVRGGMSGGPVLDDGGRVIAINGIIQLEDKSDKIVAAGIEIDTFLKWRTTVSLPTVPQASPTAGKPQTGTPANNSPRPPANAAFALASALKVSGGVVSSVAAAGSHFVSGNTDGTISVWDLPSGELKNTLRGHGDAVNAVAIASDGKIFASGSDDKTIKIWNLETGENIRTLSGHSDAVVAVALSPDGSFLASGSWDKTVKIWNVKTGALLYTLVGHSGIVNAVAIAADGKTLASGSKDGAIKLWNLQTGALIRTLKGNSLSVLSVAFSPDVKTLASGSGDGTIGLWNLGTGQLIRRLSGHTDGVWSVAISRDGNTLVSGSWDKTVKLWDLRSGELKGTLSGHSGYVTSIAISGDGQMIVSGGWEGQIKIWKRGG
ncbi:MAG TPA: trypsin-like peptidase domain-containing protein [Kamptonema sp.]|nr:trypsin-like peptidase domain-containing protein [Kamptonema sp.]